MSRPENGKTDEELDEETEKRWEDESPAAVPNPDLDHGRDPDEIPVQPNDG